MRGLIINQCVGRIFVHREEVLSPAGFAGRKTSEGEAVHGQAGEYECRHEGGRAGDHCYLYAGFEGGADEGEARIGDSGGPGAGDQGDGLALFEQGEDSSGGALFVVLVEGDLWAFDIEVLEQGAGPSGILTGDVIGVAERLNRSLRDIRQISNETYRSQSQRREASYSRPGLHQARQRITGENSIQRNANSLYAG